MAPVPLIAEVRKNLAFAFGLCIATFGVVGIIAPSCLIWVAQHFVTSGAYYVIGTIRVAFGLTLVSVASISRSPKALRVLGWLILLAGIATALTGLMGIERARATIEWWMQQGYSLLRLTAVFVLALGGFVAYACAPVRRRS